MKNKILSEKRASAIKAWDEVFKRVSHGEKVSNEEIVNVMDRLNAIDKEILAEREKLSKYLKERKDYLYD